MPTKRTILETLKNVELVELVDQFEIEVADRRIKNELVDAITKSRRATIDIIFSELRFARLKELCQELGLDDSGRSRPDVVARLKSGQRTEGRKQRPQSLETVSRRPSKKTKVSKIIQSLSTAFYRAIFQKGLRRS